MTDQQGYFFPATPYQPCQLGSTGKASSMLLRQYNFPSTYDSELDKSNCSDHDRLMGYDNKHASACFLKHAGYTDWKFESWVRGASDRDIMMFLKDILRADPKVNWTGYRVLGTVHLRNGQAVYSLQLFAKHPKSETIVYTGEDAPNVQPK